VRDIYALQLRYPSTVGHQGDRSSNATYNRTTDYRRFRPLVAKHDCVIIYGWQATTGTGKGRYLDVITVTATVRTLGYS